MRACDLFIKGPIRGYRKSINPPYKKGDLISIFATLFILIVIPLTVFAILNARNYQPRAAGQAVRGTSGDLWADIVIGQRDFTEINPNEIVPDKAFNPGGVIVDNSTANPGKAYVWDSNNNRILGIDLANCYSKQGLGTRCAGQIVLGQPSLNDYGACNHDSSSQSSTRVSASEYTLCGASDSTMSLEEERSQSNMAVDSAGNLYVADIENNRVLKYNSPFTSGTNSPANQVWGQADFTGNSPNRGGGPSASTISFNFGYWGSGGVEKHGGVAIDPQGNLWVADTANSRVLRFPKQSGEISTVADIALGQGNFTSSSTGSGLSQMKYPTAVTFDTSGNLYVADSGNNRVLFFPSVSLIPGAGIAAARTFGSDFAHAQPYTSDSTCIAGAGYTGAYYGCDGNPWNVQADPLGRGIWTSETVRWGSRMRLWGFDGTLLKNIDHGNRTGGSLGIDRSGNVLVTAVSGSNDIFRFQMQTDGSYTMAQNFFSPPGGINLVTNRRLTLAPAGGMTIVGDQLAVADGRLLFWSGLNSLTNGQAADGYLRTSSTDTINGFTDFPSPGFGYISGTTDKLWVSDFNKILIYQAPLTSGGIPIKTISSVNVLGGGIIDFSSSGQEISGIVADPTGNFVWVSQSGSHRVLRIKDPLTSTPIVDVILGQPSFQSSNYCNQNPTDPANTNGYATPISTYVHLNTLCYPGALGMDRMGNLYVSDVWHEIEGNQRLLMFSKATFPDSPSTLLAAPNSTKEFPRSQHFGTWQPAFDSTNRMVVGYNPYSKRTRRVDYFNNPTGPSTTPDGQLNDFDAWPAAAAFDSMDNLYVYETNRGQVRIYKQPFLASPPGDTTAPIVSITAPANGATVSGSSVALSATASDNVGVTKVEFYVDNVLKGADTSDPYTYSWDTTGYSNASHSLYGIAYDTVGNSGTSQTISVTVSNEAFCTKTGDLNCDNSVNILDLSILLSRWDSADTTADLNKSGKVDILDLSILLSKWGS